MRPRDPRRLLAHRRRGRARVRLLDLPRSEEAPDGSVTSRQTAEVTLPRSELERLWSPEYLERLARTYWRFLTRISLGLLRVVYAPDSRQVVLVGRPLVLLSFLPPEYRTDRAGGSVTWRIDGGLLVAPSGRGAGYLRIAVRRPPERDGGSSEVTVTVTSEVASFYPAIAAARPGGRRGLLARIGRLAYGLTQLRVHVVVTNAFLRSLARLDLAPSVVGALRPPERRAELSRR